MATRDPRIDAYIAKSADFARPILEHLRDVVHSASPDIEETIKWGFPHFECEGILCSMAAFKQHCAFGFWNHAMVVGEGTGAGAMGSFGRITSVKDLPPKKTLAGYVKKAVELKKQGVKPVRNKTRTIKPLATPDWFTAALKKHRAAAATFAALPPSQQRDYVEWLTDAKTDATRERRLTTTLAWLAEGKPRNWKYMKERAR